jgi:hypothetical protein
LARPGSEGFYLGFLEEPSNKAQFKLYCEDKILVFQINQKLKFLKNLMKGENIG